MRIVRMVLILILTLSVPFQGFASASRHGRASESVHPTASVHSSPTTHAHAAGARGLACCQPALLPARMLAAVARERPAAPPFVTKPLASWSEPVPRKPPRS